MKAKAKKEIFICSISQSLIKVVKCSLANGSKHQFTDAQLETIPPNLDNKTLTEKINAIFKKMGYSNHPVIISLPRSSASCRYLKIPSLSSHEIERIANLQASRYLPYPSAELITGYQIIQSDKQGYSHVNLTIAHKELIERYIKIFKELKVANFKIILSSYGLADLYYFLRPEEQGAVIAVDIDADEAEIAVILQKKLIFSRSFKLNQQNESWQNLFIEELNKSRDAYLKEVSKEGINKVVVFDLGKNRELAAFIEKQAGLTVEILPVQEKIKFTEAALNNIANSANSFISLIGLGLEPPEESIVLLPKELKEISNRIVSRKKQIQLAAAILGIFLIWGLGMAKNLDNKAIYLEKLKIELAKIAKDAKPLEEIEKRAEVLQLRLHKKPSTLDIFSGLYQVIPNAVTLTNFSYEEDGDVVFRGQTTNLNSVFDLVTGLEKSEVFRTFSAKVRYATKKNTQAGEMIDFEVVCAKKK